MIHRISSRFISTNFVLSIRNFRDNHIHGCVKNITTTSFLADGCQRHIKELRHVLNSRNSDHISCRQRFYATDAEPLYDKELFEKYLEALEQSVKKEETEFTHERHVNHKVKSLLEMYTEYKDKVKEIQELMSLKSGLSTDEMEMQDLAEQEQAECQQRVTELLEQMVELVLPPVPQYNEITMEIHCAVGGKESMLFAGEIYSMYRNLAHNRGWEFNELDVISEEKDCVRRATISLSGDDIYEAMKYEGGVHRVQRVPRTESGGRIHTSTITVSILPQPEEVNITIDPNDLRVETFRASGAGGQHVNKTDSAVRIIHIPTGVRAESQIEKSQHSNKVHCMKAIQERLYQIEFDKQLEESQRFRKIQVGTASRSEKIRTYNFPQDRVTDHRIHFSTNNIQQFLNGGEPLLNMMAVIQEKSKYEILNEMLQTFQNQQTLSHLQN